MSGDCAGRCAMLPAAEPRSPKRPLCHATSPLTAVTPSACAIFASRSGAEMSGSGSVWPAPGDGDADDQGDRRQDDER